MKISTLTMLLAALVFQGSGERTQAVSINLQFFGETSPTNTVGSGNFTNLCRMAADEYEMTFLDDRILTAHCGWEPIGGAGHSLNAQTNGVITDFSIMLNNTPSNVQWSLESEPFKIPTNASYYETFADLGGGPMNTTRLWYWQTPDTHISAYYYIRHELGHGFGLSEGTPSWITYSNLGYITITAPLKYAGAIVHLQTNNSGTTPHTADGFRTVTGGSAGAGEDPGMSTMDIACIAQVGGYTNVNWEQLPILQMSRPYAVTNKVSKHLSIISSCVRLKWMDPRSRDWYLQQCTNLSGTGWTTIASSPFALTNGWSSFEAPATNGCAFYRLKQK